MSHGTIRAVRGVSFQVAPGELVAIIGPNGAGKSSLLGAIAGLYRPWEGSIRLGDRDLTGLPAEEVVRAGLALVPEHRQIFNTLTVRENLMLGTYHRYRSAKRSLAAEFAEIFAIFPRLRERQGQVAGTLSGGEQQMLAIGRGLMSHPAVLLLDEPSLGLAPLVAREILRVLSDLRARGMAIVLVEQNARAALQVADRALVLERGDLVLQGTREKLLSDHRVQAAYLGRGYTELETAP